MKKFVALLMLALVFMVSCSESEGGNGDSGTKTKGMHEISETLNENTPMVNVGDFIGAAVYTDTKVTIEGCEIAACSFNDHILVAAEDLRNYGFIVTWDQAARTLSLDAPGGFEGREPVITSTYVAPDMQELIGTKFGDVLYSDIKTYVEGMRVAGYNINGLTYISVDALYDVVSRCAYNAASNTYEIIYMNMKSFRVAGMEYNLYYERDRGEYYWLKPIPKFTRVTGIDTCMVTEQSGIVTNTYTVNSVNDITDYMLELERDDWSVYASGENEESRVILYSKSYKNGYIDFVEIRMNLDKKGDIYRNINISYFLPSVRRGNCSCKANGKSSCSGHICEVCAGQGTFVCVGCAGTGEKYNVLSEKRRCPVCAGYQKQICPNCDGAKTVFYEF